MAFRDGGFGLYAKEADGEGERELFKSPDPIFPLAWTADDQAVLFQKRSVESGSDIYQVASDGSGSAKPVLKRTLKASRYGTCAKRPWLLPGWHT